jgi:hypothetical protein
VKQRELPPGYVELVRQLTELIVQWCGEQPTLPDLRWLDPGKTMFIGALQGSGVKLLADSPDAFRLIEWLDIQTSRKATLFQATMALRLLGHLPGGQETESLRSSQAFRTLEAFARQTGTETQMPPSPCGHCGRSNELATGEEGHAPQPGAFAVCAGCAGINRYGDALQLVAVAEAEIEAMPPEHRTVLREHQDLLRTARMQYGGAARRPKTVIES